MSVYTDSAYCSQQYVFDPDPARTSVNRLLSFVHIPKAGWQQFSTTDASPLAFLIRNTIRSPYLQSLFDQRSPVAVAICCYFIQRHLLFSCLLSRSMCPVETWLFVFFKVFGKLLVSPGSSINIFVCYVFRSAHSKWSLPEHVMSRTPGVFLLFYLWCPSLTIVYGATLLRTQDFGRFPSQTRTTSGNRP